VIDLDFLSNLTTEAAGAILEVYNSTSSAKKEEDISPQTLAKSRAYNILSHGLRSRHPDIPAISEEDKDTPYSTRRAWPRFWLFNSLDGVEGFLQRNDEFTINIALIEGSLPVFGAICLPVRGLLYMAARGAGCWKIENGIRHSLRVTIPPAERPIRVVVSRPPVSPDLYSLVELLPGRSVTLNRGSALKFCALAAGEADFYPQLDATWEWDTAAGQVLVMEAGGVMTGIKGEPVTYNKPDLRNTPFLVAPSLSWLQKMDVLDYQEKLANWKFEVCAVSCR
jgi:3'(2'), 5'-bisphosphate nucleotidase